ncbi:MAG: hypothetical protein ACK53B_05580 [Bacteroidota bacterium]
MKKILLLLSISLLSGSAPAQDSLQRTPTIAVLLPLYIDSAFNADNYKLGNGGLPRYMLPALEFYQGMQLAIDSLNKEKINLSVQFHDTKTAAAGMDSSLVNEAIKKADLLIAMFNNRNEIKPAATFSRDNKIPLLSYTFPNDGGVTAHPYFVLINPTLKTHLEAIFKYLQRNHPLQTIFLYKRKGATEELIQQIFEELNSTTKASRLKIKPVELTDQFTPEEATAALDSTRENLVICGSLQDEFALNLTKTLGAAKSYRQTIIGMPTWETGRDYSQFGEIIYTSHFQTQRNEKAQRNISTAYQKKLAGRASDMVYKGFEAMYRFGKILARNKSQFMSLLSDKSFNLLNDFDIRAVNVPTDYYENKKIYFIRKQQGLIKSIRE